MRALLPPRHRVVEDAGAREAKRTMGLYEEDRPRGRGPIAHLRDAYARFAAGDPSGMAAFLAEDVVYHLPGAHLGGGRVDGRAALFGRLAAAARWCDAPPEIE